MQGAGNLDQILGVLNPPPMEHLATKKVPLLDDTAVNALDDVANPSDETVVVGRSRFELGLGLLASLHFHFVLHVYGRCKKWLPTL